MKKINTTVFWKVPGTYFSLLSFIEIDIRVMALIMWNNISGKFFWLELFKVYISLVLHDNDRYPALMIYAFEKKMNIFLRYLVSILSYTRLTYLTFYWFLISFVFLQYSLLVYIFLPLSLYAFFSLTCFSL